MRDARDTEARLAVLRRLLQLVTDPRAADAIRESIAQIESMPAHLPDAPPQQAESAA